MRLYALASLLSAAGLALGAAGSTPTDPQAPPPGFGCHGAAPTADAGAAEPMGLISGLGDGGYAAEQVGEQARPWFEEGVRLTHAFNAPDAIRAFKRAETLQPDCAMCFWGEAWARGPTINYPIDVKTSGVAREAALRAQTLSVGLSDKAKGLIDAQLALLPAKPRVQLGGPDDKAYAVAMTALADRFPGDDALQVEAASALLIASGDAWTEKAATPGSNSALAQGRLEKVLARSPDFTPAIHFYIHLMEWTHSPEKAAPYAERLGRLAPNAGHLVHMPSHLWFRLGRYEDGSQANVAASAADERAAGTFKTDGGVKNFALHGHNLSFGLASALMSGDRAAALDLARQTLKEYPEDKGGLLVKAYQAMARGASVADVEALQEPKETDLKASWRYARGLSKLWAGDAPGARAEAAELRTLANAPRLSDGSRDTRAVLVDELTGRIALATGQARVAVEALRKAADRRDRFDTSLDPPRWGWPPRRALAAAMLQNGDAKGAERELLASLKRFPNDPMALYALSEAERRLGKAADADKRLTDAKAGWRGDPSALRLADV